jgi:hypothetical protein
MESHNHTISGNFALITPKKVLNNKCSWTKMQTNMKTLFSKSRHSFYVHRGF